MPIRVNTRGPTVARSRSRYLRPGRLLCRCLGPLPLREPMCWLCPWPLSPWSFVVRRIAGDDARRISRQHVAANGRGAIISAIAERAVRAREQVRHVQGEHPSEKGDEIDEELARRVASGELIEGPEGEDIKSQIDMIMCCCRSDPFQRLGQISLKKFVVAF